MNDSFESLGAKPKTQRQSTPKLIKEEKYKTAGKNRGNKKDDKTEEEKDKLLINTLSALLEGQNESRQAFSLLLQDMRRGEERNRMANERQNFRQIAYHHPFYMMAVLTGEGL